MEEIIQLLNICRYLKYFHISLIFLTNSPSGDSNITFHVFLTFPFIDIIITVVMNSILNLFSYSEDIILGNYHLHLDPASTSEYQQLILSSLIFIHTSCSCEWDLWCSEQETILPPPDLWLYTGWRTLLVQRHLYQAEAFPRGEEA